MKISYCTTIRNRLPHLRDTLRANLERHVPRSGVDVEFVVLAYNDPWAALWVAHMFPKELASGRVVLWEEREAPVFRHAKAKNLAALASTGDVIVNVDADTIVAYRSHLLLAAYFDTPELRVINEGGGFVALRRRDFLDLSGYDEALIGWGMEDLDLVERAAQRGFSRFLTHQFIERRIEHDDRSRNADSGFSEDVTPEKTLAVQRQQVAAASRKVNPSGWGRGQLWRYPEDEVRQFPESAL